jgi:hypothetical protein
MLRLTLTFRAGSFFGVERIKARLASAPLISRQTTFAALSGKQLVVIIQRTLCIRVAIISFFERVKFAVVLGRFVMGDIASARGCAKKAA